LFRPSPEVKASLHSDGIAFLDLGTGAVLNANLLAARIWQAAVDGKSLKGIVEELSRDLASPEDVVRPDVERFLSQLLEKRLLICDGKHSGALQ
jgi:hypothetical protein